MAFQVAASGWLTAVTAAVGRDVLGDATWERGAAYAAAGHVLSIASADRGRMLLAEVQGTRDSPYQTLVTADAGTGERAIAELVAAGKRPWTSRCSCPMRTECKHVAAVLASAAAAHEAQRRPPPTQPDWESVFTPMLEGPQGPDGAARQDSPAGAIAAPPLGLIVDLVLRPGPRRMPEHRVGIQATRRLVTGQWARRLPWTELNDQRRHPAPADQREALAQIRRLGTAHLPMYAQLGATELFLDTMGPQVWPMLHHCVDTGVELIGPRASGLRIELFPQDAEVTVDISGGDGDLQVQIDLGDDVFPADAQRGLIGAQAHGLWAKWDDEGPVLGLRGFTRVLPDTLRSVALDHATLIVPRADAERFRRLFLPRLSGVIRIRARDGALEAPREPRVVVTVDVRTGERNGVDVDLAVGYDVGGGVVITLDHAAAPGLRDPVAEQRLLASLEILDALPGARHHVPGLGRGGRMEHHWLAGNVELRGIPAATFVIDTLPALEAHPQVIVRVHGDLPAYHEVTEAPTIEVAASPDPAAGTDWLDLHIVVRVDEQEVPFEPLFQALVRGEETMVLDSGTWFRLDHPDLIRLRDLIAEARELDDTPRPGRARVNRFQVSLFDDLDDVAELRGADAWRGRLAALRGLDLTARPVPAGLTATLRPYQEGGFQWLAALWEAGLGGILADDMGLGKTLQVLAVLLHAQRRGDLTDPVLVVAPTSVLETWRSEAARFAPSLRTVILGETQRRRGVPLADSVCGMDLVVTSYAVCRIDAEAFEAVSWRGVVLDEAQFVKNPRSKGHAVIRRLRASFVLAVTGTPLENSLMDLWSLLALAAPGLYPRADVFSTRYRRPIESGVEPERLDQLRRRVRPLMLRRAKSEVAAELPDKQVQVLDISLGAAHARIYERQLQRERQRVLGLLADPEANRIAILASITRLRQLALDPALVDDEHGEVGSAKVDALVEHLLELRREGHRALVFSQFTRFLRRVQARLQREGIATAYLDGSTTNRPEVIRGFREGDATAFLISLKAGGFGLTLTEADYVFVLDPWWNPAAEAQAIDRTHRIGQTSNVIVYRLIAVGTIEEKVLALQERKRDLFTRVVDEGGALSGALTAQDIRALFDAGE